VSALTEVLKHETRTESRSGRLAAYIELTKPGIVSFITLSAATGYYLADGAARGVFVFCCAILGIGLTAAGSAALNEYLERDLDASMKRTVTRPLPSERLSEPGALYFGLAITLIGLAALLTIVGWTTALLAALSFVSYVFVYTPLKRRTPICTLVGGIPGALPIVAGWSARGSIDTLAPWTLFALMFCWQIPHFLSLAWLYREDYHAAGFKMLTARDPDGRLTSRVSMLWAGLLVIATTLPFGVGFAHLLYGVTAPVVAVVFFLGAVAMHPDAMEKGARRLFLMSLAYLPVVFLLLLLDRIIAD
jgi:protoheme IX farnesyltransferase